VIDFDEFQATFEENELEGKIVIVESEKLKKIWDRQVLEVLNDFSKGRYFNATVDAINVKKTALNEGMRPLVEAYRGFFSIKRLPPGYTAEQVKPFIFAPNFEAYLADKTGQKRKVWKKYVLSSGEYDHLSRQELLQAAANPNETLEVAHLLEIFEAHKIFYKGVLVGYFIEVTDHVQAQIYQDGAWINMFLDAEQNVLKAFDQSA
jgi:hypothetical protein